MGGENDRIDRVIAAALRHLPVTVPIAWLAAPWLDVVGDVFLYFGTPQGVRIRKAVRTAIHKYPGCVLVAHSLGSVIVADILNQYMRKRRRGNREVSALVTFGSPLNFLGLSGGARMDHGFPFPWYDLFYPADRIHGRTPLNDKRFPGVISRPMARDQGFVPSHSSYWGSQVVSQLIYQLTVKGGPS